MGLAYLSLFLSENFKAYCKFSNIFFNIYIIKILLSINFLKLTINSKIKNHEFSK